MKRNPASAAAGRSTPQGKGKAPAANDTTTSPHHGVPDQSPQAPQQSTQPQQLRRWNDVTNTVVTNTAVPRRTRRRRGGVASTNTMASDLMVRRAMRALVMFAAVFFSIALSMHVWLEEYWEQKWAPDLDRPSAYGVPHNNNDKAAFALQSGKYYNFRDSLPDVNTTTTTVTRKAAAAPLVSQPSSDQPISILDAFLHPAQHEEAPTSDVPAAAAAEVHADASSSLPTTIDMRQLSATLPFENRAGGAWTQGFPLKQKIVANLSEPLQIFVVPHSHCDPGWIKTFDQYFRRQTRQIITNVVNALAKDKSRKFIWAEISYFSWWWEEQNDETHNLVRRLLDDKQLEFVTGGWVQPDEANSHIDALEIQMQEGHDWIRETLGEQYIPRYGWSIDPFGYSSTMPYLLKKFNFTAMLIQRVHYAVKRELALHRHLEFNWRQTWDPEGKYDMFTHVMPFYSYDVPHTCGPDPSICCQFDFARKPLGTLAKCPWKKNPIPIERGNLHERSLMLIDQYMKKASLYRGNAVLIQLGDDFRYCHPREPELQFSNYEKIFDYVNKNFRGVNVRFGTLSEYFDTVVGTFEPPLLKGSFFTYADVNDDYWSGYFTSRAFDKALDRRLERVLYAAEALGASRKALQDSRRQLSLFQHHDGVTGTAKTFVVQDYAQRMYNATRDAQVWIRGAMREKLPEMAKKNGTIDACWFADAPRGMTENQCQGEIYVFNPLEMPQYCGDKRVEGREVTTATLPCETPGPLPNSTLDLEFDPRTGLLTSPFKEDWLMWNVEHGGAYLFVPGKLVRYPMSAARVKNNGYITKSDHWRRLLVERPTPPGMNVTVLDFIYEINLQQPNQEWLVRFTTDINSTGTFYTDLNGFNFDTHHRRTDLPIQSQVFPMPTHAAIQDKSSRLTVLSEHAQGTASLVDGTIDVFLDRRLKQDDGRGVGQGVQDNVPTRTRFRVILEHGEFDTGSEFQISRFCRDEWNKLNHPLVMFGNLVSRTVVHDIPSDVNIVVPKPKGRGGTAQGKPGGQAAPPEHPNAEPNSEPQGQETAPWAARGISVNRRRPEAKAQESVETWYKHKKEEFERMQANGVGRIVQGEHGHGTDSGEKRAEGGMEPIGYDGNAIDEMNAANPIDEMMGQQVTA